MPRAVRPSEASTFSAPSAPPARLLVVDDDRAFRLSTAALLRADGHEVESVADGQAAVAALRARRVDLVLLDLRMPGTDGLGIVEALRLWGDDVPILMISGAGTVESAVRALHLGADDFLTKPVEPDALSARVHELLARRPRGGAEDLALPGLIGRSAPMRALAAAVRQVAPSDATVLITGETGTGKERVARAVHELSPRRAAPFVVVDCAALGEGVLESELFGHTKGAFTGAVRDRVGAFEAADGGTVFLDEIGEVSPRFQQRLLRVLQEREVTRVGATRAVHVNVRVVAATNRDLPGMVVSGGFREDLYYRLAVFPVEVPSLRDRPGDIPLLVDHAVRQARDDRGPAMMPSWTAPCSPLAMRVLRAHAWPGNVRELLAAVASAAIRAEGGRIEAQHLPASVRVPGATAPPRYQPRATEDGERDAIVFALAQTGGALARTAELLGMGRTTLWRKLKAYGIDPSR
jgi:two-component system, NtrC family, response regulator HydG